jgi:hypothetical protein
MSVCNIVSYQVELLFASVAEEEFPPAIPKWMRKEHIALVREDYAEMKDTIVNFKEPW